MADLTPEGIARGGPFEGQKVPIKRTDVAVDTANNEFAFASPTGVTGIAGITGITNTTQGITGANFLGATGILGATGSLGATGVVGLPGFTGIFGLRGLSSGVTGLNGETGIQGDTGITGDTGIRSLIGIQGFTGAASAGDNPGATGLAGDNPGVTGLLGETGITQALQGETGIAGLGNTGLQGEVGIAGETGLAGNAHVGVVIGDSTSLATNVAAGTLSADLQQLDFAGIGYTADDAATTVTLSLGSTNLFSRTFGLFSDTFSVSGTILRTGSSSQRIGIQLLFDSGKVMAFSVTASEDLTVDNSLTLTVSSSGAGQGVERLTTTKFEGI